MDDNLLYRQIHPKTIQAGVVTSQAFNPLSRTRLSVYNDNMIDAEPAWKHFTENGNKSIVVMVVTEVECKSQNLTVIFDHKPYKEHAVIGFDDLTRSTIKRIAGKLAIRANKRGWCYRQNPP